MKREDVYKLIDGERDYQDSKWSEGRPSYLPKSDEETAVAAWIVYIEHHFDAAKLCVYNLDEKAALEQIRKVTALGVACMENNETPAR